ncbi:MAG TPA: SAV_6107 family HEPN domain-containing protein [Acidobacteriaceae bacterium]|nr:SAV_6107 family HEPN domain-containing protein [Acidobacteriaceae bacterium]
MNWKHLLAKGEVKSHQTSRQELDNIRALIARDLADAALEDLSADRRFATAYNAALQTGKIAIACSGYRVSARAGHHAVTFEAAHLAIGPEAAALTDYFDACRRKRNVIDYDNSSVATETEADEILMKATEFLALIEKWVDTHHAAWKKAR